VVARKGNLIGKADLAKFGLLPGQTRLIFRMLTEKGFQLSDAEKYKFAKRMPGRAFRI